MKQDLKAKIIARAWKDEAFRKKLLTQPRAALKEFGIEVPNDIDLKVLAEDPTHAYFILPQQPSELSELSEANAQKIAGGDCWHFRECNTAKNPTW